MHTPSLPRGLVEAIRSGRCVAFVGAGFSLPAVPGWLELLRALSRLVPDGPSRTDVESLLGSASPAAMDLEAAAQMIRDAAPDGEVERMIGELTRSDGALAPRIKRRAELLGRVPFETVLTTNYDDFIPGEAPGPDSYRTLLRRPPRAWRFADRVTALKLHGEPGGEAGVVLSREDYRRRLHHDARYATFLRTVLSTRVVLFLGVSFTDAYLNELRSEVLALLGRGAEPLAYALVGDCSEARARYFLDHEGIEVIPYDSAVPPGHEGFDAFLERLAEETDVHATLRGAVAGRRVVWLDPNPENNEPAWRLLEDDRRSQGVLRETHTVEETLAELDDADLIITHYGWSPDGRPTAVRLLQAIRQRESGCPVIVFASETDADVRRREVQRLGAVDYCHAWHDLFATLAHHFRAREDG